MGFGYRPALRAAAASFYVRRRQSISDSDGHCAGAHSIEYSAPHDDHESVSVSLRLRRFFSVRPFSCFSLSVPRMHLCRSLANQTGADRVVSDARRRRCFTSKQINIAFSGVLRPPPVLREVRSPSVTALRHGRTRCSSVCLSEEVAVLVRPRRMQTSMIA